MRPPPLRTLRMAEASSAVMAEKSRPLHVGLHDVVVLVEVDAGQYSRLVSRPWRYRAHCALNASRAKSSTKLRGQQEQQWV